MYNVQFAQRFHLFWRLLHNPQLSSLGSSNANLTSVCVSPFWEFRNEFMRHGWSYSVKACNSGPSVNICNGNMNMRCNLERSYQVVVAATREMGIGVDGKLPWNLPSDLRYFKELTTFTSDDGKRNAVIMGRTTWESIPLKYRPLPGRLNVVLTRAGRLEVAPSFEDLLVCHDLSVALKLLTDPPHSVSIEKVFVIGGGQILREALNGRNCEAIHLTDIDASIKCDTFVPRINLSLFRPLISSGQMEENDIQFSFVTYVRLSNSAEESYSSQIDDGCNFDRETGRIVGLSLKKRLAEFDYLKQIQENIVNGKHCLMKQ